MLRQAQRSDRPTAALDGDDPPAPLSIRKTNLARLPLHDAGNVFECSDEKLHKLCEATAGTKRTLGINSRIAGWLACRDCSAILIKGRLDRDRSGLNARRRAQERAKKYEGSALPQEVQAQKQAQKQKA